MMMVIKVPFFVKGPLVEPFVFFDHFISCYFVVMCTFLAYIYCFSNFGILSLEILTIISFCIFIELLSI